MSDAMIEAMARGACAADCRGTPHICDMEGRHCKPEACRLWHIKSDETAAAARAMCAHFGLDADGLRASASAVCDDPNGFQSTAQLNAMHALLRSLAALMETPDAG